MELCPSSRRCSSLVSSTLVLLALVLAASAPSVVTGFQVGSRWSHSASTLVPRAWGPAFTSSRLQNPQQHGCSHPRKIRSSTRNTHSVVLKSALVTAVDAFFQSYPYAAAALTCGVKASTADWVAQKRSYRKRNEKEALKTSSSSSASPTSSELSSSSAQGGSSAGVAVALPAVAASPPTTDVKRNVAYLLYGAVYQGMAQEFIYNHLYPVMFGSGTSIAVVACKVLFDLLVQTTLVTLPIAYLTKALIYNYSAREALRRYWDDILNHGLLKKYFLLWGPVQCLTFSIVPEHYRVTFIACVSFFWIIILSTIASRTSIPVKKTASSTPTETVAATAAVEGELSSSSSSSSSLSEPMATVVIDNIEDEDEEDILECEFVDGLTCNVDG